jgi:hypothetical protein
MHLQKENSGTQSDAHEEQDKQTGDKFGPIHRKQKRWLMPLAKNSGNFF